MKKGLLHWFIISTFVSLYLIVSIISTIHVVEFFKLSNPYWLSVSLAIAFEVGAAASLASLIVLDKMNKFLVWVLFITLTLMQAMGNTYYAFTNLHDYQSWIELFGLVDEDIIYQKRMLSLISGAILPLVALGFIKSLVDYIKPSESLQDSEAEQKIDGSVNNTQKNSVMNPAMVYIQGEEESTNNLTDVQNLPAENVEDSTLDNSSNLEHDRVFSSHQIDEYQKTPDIQHINHKRIEDPVLLYKNTLKNNIN